MDLVEIDAGATIPEVQRELRRHVAEHFGADEV